MSLVSAQIETHYVSPLNVSDSADIIQLIDQATAIQYEKPDSALELAGKALMLAKRTGNKRNIIRALMTITAVFNNGKTDFRKAEDYIMQALHYASGLPENDILLPRLYNGIANSYYAKSDYDSASYYYFKSLTLLDKYKSKDTTTYILVYKNISGMYGDLGRIDRTLFYFRKMAKLATIVGDSLSLAGGYLCLGAAYFNTYFDYFNENVSQDAGDTALYYFHKALDLYRPLKKPQPLILVYHAIGFDLTLKKDLKSARKYYDSAISVDKDIAKTNAQFVKGLGVLELNAGNYNKAIYYFNKGLALSKERRGRLYELDIYKFLGIAYSQQGNYKKAYQYQQFYSLLHDSFINDKMINAVSSLEVEYRASEKDKKIAQNQLQLALAESKLSKNRNVYISFIGGGIILVIAFIAFIQKQRLQLQRADVTRQKQKMDQLKAAIDSEEKEKSRIGRQLHDDIMVELSIVKMGLSSLPIDHPEIKNTNNYKNLVEQLNNTSRKLRQTAHNLMPDVLLEEGLVPAVSYFCNNIKKMTGLQVRFQYYGAIPRMEPDKEVNVYRIIQELLQNIIKHAHAKNVLVQLNYYEKVLSITVEDDGTGFDINQIAPGAAMGLKSIQTRIKAIEGNIEFYPRTPHGTSVNIALPA